MRVSLKILESNKQIYSLILNSLAPEIDDYLKKVLQIIRKELPLLVKTILQNTPEYASLMGGQLQYEFGIPDPANKISQIIDIWTNNIFIQYNAPTIISEKIKASFSVSLIKSDFSDVLSSDASFVFDNLKGYQLPWLEWLLLEGNKTIIKNYDVVFGPNKNSRTGYAVMRNSNKSWKVPSEFAGTINDNWITRAIDGSEDQINELLERAFAS